ncbi:hypothetical protein SLEP1_g38154 [Rubroshorea leprosula]|uniref:Uncharacterized protein n=1 Tax=Rubroshorea leprosula TaxID=152421 RepID=A0AAV5KXE5_9ROSI|nr:hypothetical protein SLEP1_g38154 [Rubroshorea leprosula]
MVDARMRGRVRDRQTDKQRTKVRQTAQSWEFVGKQRSVERQNGIGTKGKSQREFVPWGYDRSIYNQAVAYFFTNFPEDWSHAEMWGTFKKFGRVLAIYSPPRKDRSGKRFGFVRFLDVRNEWELERHLDQIRIGKYKLWVNKAKFSREDSMKKQLSREDIGVDKSRKASYAEASYAEVLKGATGTGADLEQRQTSRLGLGKEQVWQVRNKEEGSGLVFNTKKEDQTWLEGCYIGTTYSVEAIRNLQEKFYMEGLLDCKYKEELKDVVELGKDWLSQWFQEVRPWSPNIIASERFLISTSAMEFISKKLQIEVDGRPVNLKIIEEESANGIFNMKTDFKPCFASNFEEEDDESWSMGYADEEAMADEPDEVKQIVFSSDSTHKKDDDVAAKDAVVDESSVNLLVHMNVVCQAFESNFGGTKESTYQPPRSMGNEPGAGGIVADSLLETQVMTCRGGRKDLKGGLCVENGHEKLSIQNGLDEESLAPLYNSNRPTENINPRFDGGTCEVGEEAHSIENQAKMDKKEDSGRGQRGTLNRESPFKSDGGVERDSEKSFWEGLESDSGRLEEWMGRGKSCGLKKRKGRKARSCAYVYISAPIILRHAARNGGRKKQHKKPGLEDKIPIFLGKDNKVAGESIGDSEIANCNRDRLKQAELGGAAKIWNLAKKIGVVAMGNEGEVLQQLEEMEQRDKKGWKIEANMHAVSGREDGKKRELRELLIKEKVEFVAIQESKLEHVDKKLCRSIWGFENMDWIAKQAEGQSGGLISIWNSDVFRKHKNFEGDGYIAVFGFWGLEGTPVNIVNVYAPCEMQGKRRLWEDLKRLIHEQKGNLCVMGDFNAIKCKEEFAGSRRQQCELKEFDEFILETELQDLPLIRRKFTCYHSNRNSMSRLDRFLLSEEWLLNWGEVKQWGLKRSISDHCPILLKDEKIDWGPKPFKVFDAWFDQPDFQESITTTWRTFLIVQGRRSFILKEKLKKLKAFLKNQSKNIMLEVDNRINLAKDIRKIDLIGESQQLSEIEKDIRKNNQLELWNSLKTKERMWRQKARKEWIKDGDENTRFFHKCGKGRWRRNEINSIWIDDNNFQGVDKIKEEIATHFEKMFMEEDWVRLTLQGLHFKQLSVEQNEALTAQFEEEEVRRVIWECDSSKAPGSDGFNFNFIKRMWDVMKEDILGFVHEFHEFGKLNKGLNTSFLVLIPKTENPQKIDEFRPISLIHSMYKIIAKLLANRLRQVMDGLIGEQQMAFLSGRQLSEGVVIANEVLDEAKRKKLKTFAFKVDFEKAYDKVSWNFLEFMMMSMGFHEQWRRWIMECLQSSSVSVLANGSATRQFQVQRGLRQGDPLSLFIFLIVAEGLNGLI